jgi:hypothetical protein
MSALDAKRQLNVAIVTILSVIFCVMVEKNTPLPLTGLPIFFGEEY